VADGHSPIRPARERDPGHPSSRSDVSSRIDGFRHNKGVLSTLVPEPAPKGAVRLMVPRGEFFHGGSNLFPPSTPRPGKSSASVKLYSDLTPSSGGMRESRSASRDMPA
jgi:hypothetical protein